MDERVPCAVGTYGVRLAIRFSMLHDMVENDSD